MTKSIVDKLGDYKALLELAGGIHVLDRIIAHGNKGNLQHISLAALIAVQEHLMREYIQLYELRKKGPKHDNTS